MLHVDQSILPTQISAQRFKFLEETWKPIFSDALHAIWTLLSCEEQNMYLSPDVQTFKSDCRRYAPVIAVKVGSTKHGNRDAELSFSSSLSIILFWVGSFPRKKTHLKSVKYNVK